VKIAYVSLGSEHDVRFHKVAGTLARLRHEVVFVGVNRDPSTELPSPPVTVRTTVLSRKLPNGSGLLVHLPAIAAHLVGSVAREKPDAVYCVNEEVAVLMAGFARLARREMTIVCDIYDSLALRTSGTTVNPVARLISALADRWADTLIVTDENRRSLLSPRWQPKTVVLPNYPVYASHGLPESRPTGPVKVLVAGALAPSRGLAQLLAACDNVPGAEIWCAGQATSTYVRNVFLRQPRVRYRGILPHTAVIELALECDALFAFYAPTNLNNVNASPNKVFDALLAGRPVIVNAEVKIADFVLEHRCGLVCGYDDRAALTAIIRSLVDQRPRLPEYERRVRTLGARAFSWEVAEAELARLFPEEAGQPPQRA